MHRFIQKLNLVLFLGLVAIMVISIARADVEEPAKVNKSTNSASWATIGIKGLYQRTDTSFVALMPEESVKIHIIPHVNIEDVRWRAFEGKLSEKGTFTKTYKAPAKPGYYPIKIFADAWPGYMEGDKTLRAHINVFVMYPASRVKDGYLNGYQIGEYPDLSKKGKDYKAPKGYIEVEKEHADAMVSQNYALGDFLCNRPVTWPKYVVLSEGIVHKLETINLRMKEMGVVTEGNKLQILSAYRTPAYNVKPGQAKTSRHIFGAAVDIFVDNNNNGEADDINHDGKYDEDDAFIIYSIIDNMEKRNMLKNVTGGIGLYARSSSLDAFVHVDVRSISVRWGSIGGSKIQDFNSWAKKKNFQLKDIAVEKNKEQHGEHDQRALSEILKN